MEIKFKLYDKDGNHIGYEYHERNEFSCYQIYHQSTRGDFEHTGKKLVREGWFIAATHKEQYVGLKDKNGEELYNGDLVGYKDPNRYPCKIWKIISYNGAFRLNSTKPRDIRIYDIGTCNDLEKIGNIHTNLELKKKS